MKVIMAEQLSKRIQISKETNPHLDSQEAKMHNREHVHILRMIERVPGVEAETLISREELAEALKNEFDDIEADIIDVFRDKDVRIVKAAVQTSRAVLEIVKKIVHEIPSAFTGVSNHDISKKDHVVNRAE